MKKNVKLIVSGVVFVLIVTFGFIEYKTKYALTKVLQTSHNDYSLVINMVGEPVMPYGETKCRAIFYGDGKKINTYDFTYLDDGAKADADNFTIEWFEKYVRIIVNASEEKNNVATYDFYYIVD